MRKYYMSKSWRRPYRANAQVAQSLFKQATNRDKAERLRHAIFWLKCAIKWRGTARRRWAKGSREVLSKVVRPWNGLGRAVAVIYAGMGHKLP